MHLIKWYPTRNSSPRMQGMDALINDFFGSFGDDSSVYAHSEMPRTDITEDQRAIYLKLEMPGLSKDSLRVNVENGLLSVAGENTQSPETEDLTWLRRERSTGGFRREFQLSDTVDTTAIEAAYEQGILQITLPKTVSDKAREIQISIK